MAWANQTQSILKENDYAYFLLDKYEELLIETEYAERKRDSSFRKRTRNKWHELHMECLNLSYDILERIKEVVEEIQNG